MRNEFLDESAAQLGVKGVCVNAGSHPINIPWRVRVHRAYEGDEHNGPPKCYLSMSFWCVVCCAVVKKSKLE